MRVAELLAAGPARSVGKRTGPGRAGLDPTDGTVQTFIHSLRICVAVSFRAAGLVTNVGTESLLLQHESTRSPSGRVGSFERRRRSLLGDAGNAKK